MSTRAAPLPTMADDAAARERALDVRTSFIVQAPAGSGKTELLIQRYLALLATVDEPEEIAAITFTRKAAAEMAQRVQAALARAAGPEPESAHHRVTWRLARAAAARDAERGWQLSRHPGRLRMQTIDSLCAALTRQMPLVARFGAQPAITERADAMYEEAARNTLALLDSRDPLADRVAHLLTHLDNQLPRAIRLLADMLKTRDQWLRHLHGSGNREWLEAALANIRKRALLRAHAALPPGFSEMMELAAWAGEQLATTAPDAPIAALAGDASVPRVDEADMPRWLGLVELLLKKDGDWRQKVDTRQGFPAGKTKAEKDAYGPRKERFTMLLHSLAESAEGAELAAALNALRELPPGEYSQAQWEALEAITDLLPRATAELWNVFAAHGQCDFAEVAQAASRALGDAEAPTDLALALDYRLRHLLIDEFQDTSFTQWNLLEKLTAGWQPDDGRTLFLVGDPMQSIYRFREAEVGLFLRARHRGVGLLPLEPLLLTANFRSQAGIVDWVNDTFAACMPAREDIALGAVPHAAAMAVRPALPGDAVTTHLFFSDETATEADRVVALVRAALTEDPEGDVAILVRSRSVLADIVPALRAAGLAFRAVDIDPLASRPVVRDLTALTRALLHPADRIAWLAVLRAPWCGLTLADLLALSQGRVLWSAVAAPSDDVLAALSADGRARLARLRDALAPVLADAARGGLRARVERAWWALGGPATVESAAALQDAEVFFAHLAGEERAGRIPDMAAFEASLAGLFASPDPAADARIAIMTLHKSKGLEFDTVIIPGLARKAQQSGRQLLTWLERPADSAEDGETDEANELLLAPIAEIGAEADPIGRAISAIEQQREAFERTRLLYVGTTRAKKRLHLLATLGRGADKSGEVAPRAPQKSSLLTCLWPVLEAEVAAAHATRPYVPVEAADMATPRTPLSRLPLAWQPPELGASPITPAQASEATAPIPFDWASPLARHIGTVTHAWLQRIAEQGLERWTAQRLAQSRPGIERALRQLGVAEESLDQAAGRVLAALSRTLADERGRWLLGPQTAAACEMRLTGVIDGRVRDAVIDRTFVDAEGVRWIIDYKTGGHEGGDVEAFLDQEVVRYRTQLAGYAALFPQDAARGALRLALYFPLLAGWRAWAA